MIAASTCFALLAAARPAELPRGELVEGLRCEVDPTQTYTLYLPTTYSPTGAAPALLIFDPRGRSVMAAELFREAAETHGWVILSSNDTRSDGPMEPNIKAVNALWPEVHEQYSTDPRRVYAAGFSGGAMVAWALGRATSLAGVIGAGGRFDPHHFDQEIRFPCFGAAGDTDFNYTPMRRIHDQLERWGAPHRLEIFEGRHRWMPPELATAAVEWMELMAMKQGLRERDMALVERVYAEDVAWALALAQAGEALAAQRRYAAVASTFEGLREVEAARREADRLDAATRVKQARRLEKRWDAFEASYRKQMAPAFSLLAADPPASTRRLAAELRLTELQRRATVDTYQGVVARRLLESLLTQTSFYIRRDLFKRGEWESAAKVLEIASRIRPERVDIWYNLACAHARRGSRKQALEALETAVEAGYRNAEHMATDPDLESLRGDETFERLLAGLR